MELVTHVQFLDKAVCISRHANAIEKGTNLSPLYPAMDNY